MEHLHLSSLIAGFLTFMLALMAWMNRRHERIYVSFAIFMVTSSILSLLNYKQAGLNDFTQFEYWIFRNIWW